MKPTIQAESNSMRALSAWARHGRLDAPTTPHDSSRRAARVFVRALDQACLELPDDVERRLAFAREMALQHARVGVHTTEGLNGRDAKASPLAASLGWGFLRGWTHLLPALALLIGLLTTSQLLERRNVSAAAEIDTALLNDELPPEAYADPGFVEFLKYGQAADPISEAQERRPEPALTP